MTMNKVSVLIVDDSASVRQILSTILTEDPEIEIMGTAADPYAAARRLQNEVPSKESCAKYPSASISFACCVAAAESSAFSFSAIV